MWNSEKTFQQAGFNLLTMQQTGLDLKLLPVERGPLPLIAPLCEQAKSLMEGKFSPKLLHRCTQITRKQAWERSKKKPVLRESSAGGSTDYVQVCAISRYHSVVTGHG